MTAAQTRVHDCKADFADVVRVITSDSTVEETLSSRTSLQMSLAEHSSRHWFFS